MGKPTQNSTSIQQNVPKYMRLNANTQFELAQSIDAAMDSAEREVKADQHQEALYIWYEQILDGIYEEFSLQKQPRTITDTKSIGEVVGELVPLCWAYYQTSMLDGRQETNATKRTTFELVMKRLLESSFVNALDILYARNLWRFDIQRGMQETQKHIIDGIEQRLD